MAGEANSECLVVDDVADGEDDGDMQMEMQIP